MPTYEYKCENCGHEFEQYQSITARPIRKCPKCGKTSVKRLISMGAGVIFKGPGFYQTDYRSESYKKGAEKEKGTTGKPACPEYPSKEKKPANDVSAGRSTDKPVSARPSLDGKETKAESKESKTTEKAKPVTKDKKKTA